MSPITTHILDTARGLPASAVGLTLERRDAHGQFAIIGQGTTDVDGRNRSLLGGALVSGVYRLTFDVGPYFAAHGGEAFYPSVAVLFEVKEPTQHYHIPLLISPFGYSTYRGS